MPWVAKLNNDRPLNSSLEYNTYYLVEKIDDNNVSITNHTDDSVYVEQTEWCRKNMRKPVWITREDINQIIASVIKNGMPCRDELDKIINQKLIERFG